MKKRSRIGLEQSGKVVMVTGREEDGTNGVYVRKSFHQGLRPKSQHEVTEGIITPF